MNGKKFLRGFEAITGGLLSQPNGNMIIPGAAGCFTPDYREYITLLGSLDAPDSMPSGGVRAFDGSELTIGWSHVWRPGVLEGAAS